MKRFFFYLLGFLRNERGESATFRMMNISLNMILLAFFIALNSIAVQDDMRVKRALGSLVGSFGLLTGGVNPMSGEGKSIMFKSVPMEGIDSLQYVLLERLEHKAIEIGAGEGFGIQREGDRVIMTLDDAILFQGPDPVIREEIKALLNEISQFLFKKDEIVVVRGHGGYMAAKKRRGESSWEVASRKAVAVMNYLRIRGKLKGENLSVISFGDGRPLYPPGDRAKFVKNERVELVFEESI